MARRSKKNAVNLTADEITAWAESLGGMPVKMIAERHGVSLRTAYDWIDRAKSQVNFSVEEMRQCLFTLFPDAIEALKHCLVRNRDGQIALRLLSGLTVLTDRKEIITDERPKTPAELEGQIVELVAPAATGTDPTD